jgi:hypothetical protein
MQVDTTKMVQATRGRSRSLFRRNDLSIRLRLIACFVLIVLLMIAADAVAVWQYWQMTAPAQRVSETDHISHAVVRVHLDVDTFRDRMVALASSHDTSPVFRRSGVAVLVEYCPSTLRHLPFQCVAGQSLGRCSFPNETPEVLVPLRAFARLDPPCHDSSSSHVFGGARYPYFRNRSTR